MRSSIDSSRKHAPACARLGSRSRRVFVQILVGIALATTTPAGAAPSTQAEAATTATELLARFAAVPGLSARYTEAKTMALLAAPLRSSGTLYFVPPGTMVRHQTKPSASSVLVDATALVFGGGGQIERIDLEANPVVRMFVASFVKILAGDEHALLEMYAVDYEPHADGQWTMVLRPKVAPVRRVIERITLRGRDVVLSDMDILEVGGDLTETRFFEVDPERQFSAAERRKLFRIAGE